MSPTSRPRYSATTIALEAATWAATSSIITAFSERLRPTVIFLKKDARRFGRLASALNTATERFRSSRPRNPRGDAHSKFFRDRHLRWPILRSIKARDQNALMPPTVFDSDPTANNAAGLPKVRNPDIPGQY